MPGVDSPMTGPTASFCGAAWHLRLQRLNLRPGGN